MDKIDYKGPIRYNTFKDFLITSFTVISAENNEETLRLPIIPFLQALAFTKKKISTGVDIKRLAITIPQFNLVELDVNKNPFSKEYEPIKIFGSSIFAIYFPLKNITVLYKITSNNISNVSFTQVYYNGFILKDMIYAPKFDTGIYFYRLSGSENGEPLFIYNETRYKMYDLENGTEYKFKSGAPLINLSDTIKDFYYSSALQDLIEEIIDIFNIKFVDKEFNLIDYDKGGDQ